MIQLKNASKFYYSKGIIASGFSKVNLKLSTGEFVVITGESGSGKSTLLNVISGLETYEEGEMFINGEETSHYTAENFEAYRRKYIGNIFQSFNLISSYTVYQNVELILLINGYNKDQVKEKVNKILEQVGLKEFAKTKASKLSGGQKQRVSIARALAKETSIIVADEPTGNLDSKSAEDIVELLSSLAEDKLVIVVTHNLEQFEEKATRIIRMHDGKVVEDKKVKETEERGELQESLYKDISVISKIRLGVRNSFNIMQKFLLLLIVFIFLSISITSVYASFQQRGDTFEGHIWNLFFMNATPERLVVNKADNSQFTEEDYEKIKKMNNVASIEKDDMLVDEWVSFEGSGGAFLEGNIYSQEGIDKVDVGRLPESANEFAIETYKGAINAIGTEEDALNIMYTMYSMYDEGVGTESMRLVGIKYNDIYSSKVYMHESNIANIRSEVYKKNSKIDFTINNKVYKGDETGYMLKGSDKVPEGKVYIPEEMNELFLWSSSWNKDIGISASNIYYKDQLKLKVSGIYTRKNFEALTGYKEYDMYMGTVFINTKEYNNFFIKGNYQYSVFAKNKNDVEEIKKNLEENGYKALALKDASDSIAGEGVLNIVQVPMTIFFVIVIFFVVFFVIRLILKSRGIYFTTLRILGMSKRNARRIMDIELFTVLNIAYALFLILVYLIKDGVIKVGYLVKTLTFLTGTELILLYIIILVMVYFISGKFTKSIFKKSAMGTYREEA